MDHSIASATLNVVFDSMEYQDQPTPLTPMQMAMQRRMCGWPLYAIILALGQMLGATSFQITLLSGQNWQGDVELYVLGAVFLVASIVWYSLFHLKPSFYVLSAPWIFFAIAFILIGIPAIVPDMPQASLVTGLATWCYAVASAAAFLFFGLNFGEEAVRRRYLGERKADSFRRASLRRFILCARLRCRVLSSSGWQHCGIGAINSTGDCQGKRLLGGSFLSFVRWQSFL